jgi:hypothetical protein
LWWTGDFIKWGNPAIMRQVRHDHLCVEYNWLLGARDGVRYRRYWSVNAKFQLDRWNKFKRFIEKQVTIANNNLLHTWKLLRE